MPVSDNDIKRIDIGIDIRQGEKAIEELMCLKGRWANDGYGDQFTTGIDLAISAINARIAELKEEECKYLE